MVIIPLNAQLLPRSLCTKIHWTI